MKMNPYLMFNGDCDAALKFYEQTLGAKIESKMTFAGSPAEKHVPAGWGDKVLHARLMVGDTVVMASDRRNSTKSLAASRFRFQSVTKKKVSECLMPSRKMAQR